MIDERELIKIIQMTSNKAEEYLAPEEVAKVREAASNFIEVINNIPKIEFPTYGSENSNTQEEVNDNLCSN